MSVRYVLYKPSIDLPKLKLYERWFLITFRRVVVVDTRFYLWLLLHVKASAYLFPVAALVWYKSCRAAEPDAGGQPRPQGMDE